jgi:starch-binding outer membrane protein, SusD/RagB family
MKKIIAFVLLAGLLPACDSFLEEKPLDFLGANEFYKTEKDLTVGLNAVFAIMQSQNYYQRTVWLVSELPGEYLQVSGSNGVRQEIQDFTYTGLNGEITNWWTYPYTLIGRANELLEKAPSIPMDDTKRNIAMGNARFLRGLAYFDLVRSFGDVPLVLTTTQTVADIAKPSRAPIADVYNQIIEDLKFAEANCPKESAIGSAEKGRVSTIAASALLAKVFLTRASSSAAQADDNQTALTQCNKVIDLPAGKSSQYQLLTNYADVFDIAKENGPEHIFSVQFDLPPSIGNITIQMQYPNESALIGGGGAGSFKVATAFATSYAASDTRGAWNVSNKAGTKTLSNYFFYKYRDPIRQGNNSRVNWPVLRYADVLLMQSEALNNLNPADVNKFIGINAVRARAGLTPLSLATTPTKDNFIDALLKERAWELCLEGHRRYDLIRMGRFKQVRNITNDKYLLFPVPDTETSLNPNLLPNNTGF